MAQTGDRRNSAAGYAVVHAPGQRSTGGSLGFPKSVWLGCGRGCPAALLAGKRDDNPALDMLGCQRRPQQKCGKGQSDDQRNQPPAVSHLQRPSPLAPRNEQSRNRRQLIPVLR
jgi:hypothetical protein